MLMSLRAAGSTLPHDLVVAVQGPSRRCKLSSLTCQVSSFGSKREERSALLAMILLGTCGHTLTSRHS